MPARTRALEDSALQALYDIAVLAAAGRNEPVMVARVAAEHARELLAFDNAAVFLWNDVAGRLEPAYATPSTGLESPVEPDQGIVGRVFKTGEPLAVEDYQSFPGRIATSAANGMRATLTVPLVQYGRTLGALGVWGYEARPIEEREIHVLSLFASQIAPALAAAHLQEERLDHQRQLQEIYAAMACGVVVWDAEGRIATINDNGLALFGLRREQLDGRMPADIAGWARVDAAGADMPARQRPMHVAWSSGRAVRNAVVGYRKPDGDTVWLQFDCVPALDGAGHVRQVIGSFIDITPIKRADAARLESEAKTRFLASMSHELRTPLNSILGFTQLLSAETFGALNDRQRRYVGHIASSGEHLLELVNDVLDIARVAAGRMPFANDVVDLRAVADGVMARVRPLAGARTLTVHGVRGDNAGVRGDRRRVEQVLHNLVSNAIKFTDDDGRIEIELRRRPDGMLTTVRDDGIGIPPEQTERIFEEFTQVDDSRRRRNEGTGLGLALSRRLVEEMGGRIWVESEPGSGSAFHFSLPAATARPRDEVP